MKLQTIFILSANKLYGTIFCYYVVIRAALFSFDPLNHMYTAQTMHEILRIVLPRLYYLQFCMWCKNYLFGTFYYRVNTLPGAHAKHFGSYLVLNETDHLWSNLRGCIDVDGLGHSFFWCLKEFPKRFPRFGNNFHFGIDLKWTTSRQCYQLKYLA